MKWKPIETAPKETWILCGFKGAPYWGILRQNYDGVFVAQDEEWQEPQHTLTHWMSLPEPPNV